jgi:hypothetical protein
MSKGLALKTMNGLLWAVVLKQQWMIGLIYLTRVVVVVCLVILMW